MCQSHAFPFWSWGISVPVCTISTLGGFRVPRDGHSTSLLLEHMHLHTILYFHNCTHLRIDLHPTSVPHSHSRALDQPGRPAKLPHPRTLKPRTPVLSNPTSACATSSPLPTELVLGPQQNPSLLIPPFLRAHLSPPDCTSLRAEQHPSGNFSVSTLKSLIPWPLIATATGMHRPESSPPASTVQELSHASHVPDKHTSNFRMSLINNTIELSRVL